MFAFAIWNARDRSLFLARDRLGIKPLFYADFGPKFSFGSEIKAILADQTCPRTIDETALACYFSLSYIPAPMTIYKDVANCCPVTRLPGRMVKRAFASIGIFNLNRTEERMNSIL